MSRIRKNYEDPLKRWYTIAWQYSFTSNYPAKMKRMAALVVKSNSLINKSVNQINKHAEVRCLRPHRDYEKATLVVARTNGLISRPCKKCIPIIRAAGIRNIVYINLEGNLVRELLW